MERKRSNGRGISGGSAHESGPSGCLGGLLFIPVDARICRYRADGRGRDPYAPPFVAVVIIPKPVMVRIGISPAAFGAIAPRFRSAASATRPRPSGRARRVAGGLGQPARSDARAGRELKRGTRPRASGGLP